MEEFQNCLGDLKQNITYLIGMERSEGRMDNLSAEEISKRLKCPLEEVVSAMKELGLL